MSHKKSNKVVGIPKCNDCDRDSPSMSGESFVAIPSSLNLNGKWMGTHWHLFCGNCFKDLINRTHHKDKSIKDIDFMNLFLHYPITIFKTKDQIKIEFKNY